MNSKLIRFKVQNFKSVDESDWVKVNESSCLVGTNEAGKTNFLIALWKLNPANNEPILPLEDYPRHKFVDYESTEGKEIFITADFILDQATADNISKMVGWPVELVREVRVSRRFNGRYPISFPNSRIKSFNSNLVKSKINSFLENYKSSDTYTKETDEVNLDIISSIESEEIPAGELTKESITNLKEKLQSIFFTKYSRKKNINEYFGELFKWLNQIAAAFDQEAVQSNTEISNLVLRSIPKFVYYADYGNLDSEIYLPHVIENFKRDDLSEGQRAKVRTLEVLFDFVNLSPEEILELGKESKGIKYDYNNNKIGEYIPDEKTIEKEAKSKKKREILLQSASAKLTQEFKDWWLQGDYRFRFDADGNHFRIWVSDEKRPEEIELEGRSRGLQWFFSFFLVFLVEAKGAHSNSILLLDEPGLSLHPLAQFDLTKFFNSLADQNQLLYTTHSPFLVNSDNLDDVRAVYLTEEGRSAVSKDLRKNREIASKSIYPVHASIGLTVSDTLLLGCQPALVEGRSDQVYLQIMKNVLIGEGRYKNSRELVFIPTGGVKGMSPIINILTGRENDLPFVVLDSDKAGCDMRDNLKGKLYKSEENKLIMVADILEKTGSYEIEDLMPVKILASLFAKKYRGKDDDFDESYDKELPIISQMEKFAKENDYALEEGWKVDLAKDMVIKLQKKIDEIPTEIKDIWEKLFNKLNSKF